MAYNITPANDTFSNTCPVLVNFEPTNNFVPNTCTNIAAGLYVAKPPVTKFATINLNNANAAHLYRNSARPS